MTNSATIYGRMAKCFCGWVLQAHSDQGVCAIFLGDNDTTLWQELKARFATSDVIYDPLVYMSPILDLLEDSKSGFNYPVAAQGTPFQQSVWQALRQIPAGSTRTYAEVAQAIGKPKAARAVALACGANPVAVVVPCHRVIRADGSLSGYRWGEDRKKLLLQREGVSI
jgi:AraC family transcriptional regulator of adaptative response/methylated-DNA-[protein]-cysteine methyltransferase